MNGESRRLAGLWLAVVFILGAGIGGVFTYTLTHRSVVAAPGAPPAFSEAERRAKRVAEMTREVGLTDEQSAKVDAIIHAAHDEMKAVRDKAEGDVESLRAKARDQMRTLLTPEQKPKFEAMVERMDAERKKQQGPPPAK
jgi:Spy/CpxP family protein refolding chaperone